MANLNELHRQEYARWRDNDVKGRRESMYIKEVVNVNASITTVVK